MKNEEQDSISIELQQLNLENVELFDQDVTDGMAREYFESCEITHATVYRNKLSGTVGTFVQGDQVEVSVHGNEISSTCTCSEDGEICKHAVSLMYSWIFDGEDFVNIQAVLQQMETFDKSQLLMIIKNILRQYPNLADVFLTREKVDWYDIDEEPDV